MNKEVDAFVKKAKQWKEEISELRAVLLKTELKESFKWRLPCYSFNESNVAIIQPFKSCLGMMFFKLSLRKSQVQFPMSSKRFLPKCPN